MRDTRAMIRKAFAKVPKPSGPRQIAPHDCEECNRIVRDFGPHTFDELPDKVISYHKESLSLLGPQALQHYLPAYLLYSLEHPESDVMMFTIFHLTPSKKRVEKTKAYFEERFGLFDSIQRKAVAAFLEDVRNYQLYDPHEQEFERAAELWPIEA